jgi:hypothetical protein
VIPFEFDHEAVEFLLDRAVRINEHVAIQTLPPTINSPRECSQCAFFQIACFPTVDFGPGATMIEDEDVIELARQRDANERGHLLYKEADEVLKERLRGCEQGFIGTEFAVLGRWQKKTTTNVPKEIREQYSTVDPKGTFVLKIEKLNVEGGGANGSVEVEGG